MEASLQVTFDTADPHAQADFWAAVLGYEVENGPEVSDFVDSLVESGRIQPEERIYRNGRSLFAVAAAAHDPTGTRPRLYFQKVPEGKVVKNRVHLDLNVGAENALAEVARVEALGATRLWVTDDRGPVTYTMQDPEGNEFCIS